MRGMSTENPFIDFPKYNDWFYSEKALRWRSKHEAEIVNSLKLLLLWQSEFPGKQPSEVKQEIVGLKARIEILEERK
jgi:hypothetical protein